MSRRRTEPFLGEESPQPTLRPVRRLTAVLACSVLVNVALLSALIYQNAHLSVPIGVGEPPSPWGRQGVISLAEDRTNAEVLKSLVHMLPEQLVARLGDAQLVEDGYTHRDLALGCLVTLHHFDLSKAVASETLPTERYLKVNTEFTPIAVYPGLNERQFASINHFIQTERWPLTSEGLFLALQQDTLRADQSLAEAFFLTPEYLAIQRLFAQAEKPVSKQALLQTLTDGSWEMLVSYGDRICPHDTASCTRRRLLVDYIHSGSRSAAQLMISTDPLFAAKKLDDATVMEILEMLGATDHGEDLASFAHAVAKSPRSDAVLDLARKISPSANVVLEAPVVAATAPSRPAPDRIYVVQKGDSLWKISRKVHVDIETLRAHNDLKGDLLLPGTKLKLP